MIEIFILSLIQGITEFLPISSSSHLILISEFYNFSNGGLSVDVALHIGSFFSVILFFRKDIVKFINDKILLSRFIIASIPIMFVGFFLVKYNLIDYLRNIEIIGWTTLIFGIMLFISDKTKESFIMKKNFSYKSAVIIGLVQILSLIPGVSRSGIAITGARFLGFKRYDSAKISFLLSIPTLAIISIYGIKDIVESNNYNFSILNITSIFFSFIFSYLTIKYFLKFIKRFSLNIFVIYRIVLGVFILSFVYL
tara:strand:- start:172 stop:930 length:759 start_codon:yes stop_codon:yes gene_type:complete